MADGDDAIAPSGVELLAAIEAGAEEFMHEFRATACALGLAPEFFPAGMPALAVLRFPAPHKAVILASCWHLGHDCARDVGAAEAFLDAGALAKFGRAALQSTVERLAAEGYRAEILWQCAELTQTDRALYLWQLCRAPHPTHG